MIPIAAAVSSNSIPMDFATGATYFIASPVSATAAFVAAAFLASTSATCPAELASNPNPRRVLAAISALLARSSPEEAAKSNIPGIAAMISLVLKPADARFSIPSAASVAEKAVSAPNCFACSFNFANSSPVAPEIAFTLDIWASKSIPVLTASENNFPIPIAAIPFVIVPCSLDSPDSTPELSKSVSITTFPSLIIHLSSNS